MKSLFKEKSDVAVVEQPRDKRSQSFENNISRPKPELFTPIENEFDLANIINIDLFGQESWGYLLSKGDSKKIVFAFSTTGLHESELTATQLQEIEAGLREIQKKESFVISFSSKARSYTREDCLKRRYRDLDSEEMKALVADEYASIEDLRKHNLRKVSRCIIYTTFTVNEEAAGAKDWIEGLLAKGVAFWHKHFTSNGYNKSIEYVTELLTTAHNKYIEQRNFLENKLTIPIRPLDGFELWDEIYHWFNGDTQTYPLTTTLRLDKDGLKDIFYNDRDLETDTELVSKLFKGDSLPTGTREYIYLPLKRQYIGALTFEEKPNSWVDIVSQVRWLFDNIVSLKDVEDIEIVSELTWHDPKLAKDEVSWNTNLHSGAKKAAAKHGKIDVTSKRKVEDTIAIQDQFYDGDTTVYCGMAVLIYARNIQKLDEICQHVQNQFRLPAVLVRDTRMAWHTILQTLPIRWEGVCQSQSYDRRLKFHVSEALGFVQLVNDVSLCDEGIEFVADKSKNPIYINMNSPEGNPRHIGIFGQTGSGKSVMSTALILEARQRGQVVTIMDLPTGSGNSSYTDLIKFLGGAIFDTGSECNNLLEIPNVSHLPEKIREERINTSIRYNIEAIVILVFEDDEMNDANLKAIAKSLIVIAVNKFYQEPSIQERIAKAQAEGIDSESWQCYPTIEDLYDYFDLNVLGEEASEDTQRAIAFVRLRLRYWMSSPFGKLLCQPSTFDTSSDLTLYALRELSNEAEATIHALSAYTASRRNCLRSPRSMFYVDEASVLCGYKGIAKSVATLIATGRKSGLSVILATQDPDTFAGSLDGKKILQGFSVKLVGKINPSALDSFQAILKIPMEFLKKQLRTPAQMRINNPYRKWILDEDSQLTFVRQYVPPKLLALTANNPPEVMMRRRIFAEYRDKFEALDKAANQYFQEFLKARGQSHENS